MRRVIEETIDMSLRGWSSRYDNDNDDIKARKA